MGQGMGGGPKPRNVIDRLCEKIVQDASTGCWLWIGSIVNAGYGSTWDLPKQRSREAHTVSYEAFIGPVPDNLTLDHLCRIRRCVNPTHLEPVTNVENVMRGEGFGAVNSRKVVCSRGHPYNEENTYHWRGQRCCRSCHAINELKRWRRLNPTKPHRKLITKEVTE